MPSKGKNRVRYVTLKGVENEKRALQRELLAWGVDTHNNADHVRFAAHVAAEVHSCQNAEPMCEAQPTNLPQDDVEEAVRIIFRDNIVTCPIETHAVDDKFTPGGGGDDRCCNVYPTEEKNKVKVQVRWCFDRFSLGALDPLQRFAYVGPLVGMERFRHQLSDLDSDEIKGLAFEAMIAHCASYNEACYHCKCRKTLKWAGGGQSPWTDMVCTFCDSAYEIKTKRNMEAVEKAGDTQSHYGIGGGSYRGYCIVHNDPSRKVGWKHYLVLMSRRTSDRYDAETRSHRSMWQVQIGEIRTVEPRLTSQSFIPELPLRLKSMITMKGEPKAWFSIPYQKLDYGNLYRSVLIDEFYPDLVAPGTALGQDPPAIVDTESSVVAVSPPSEDNDNLLLELALDDQSVDDWEERESDDE